MTDVYERDLFGMKYAILKSPYHKKVITTCAEILDIPPMKMRQILIEQLDMMMLESIIARYDSWTLNGDKEPGIRKNIGYELFTRYIPIIPEPVMEMAVTTAEIRGGTLEEMQKTARMVLAREMNQ